MVRVCKVSENYFKIENVTWVSVSLGGLETMFELSSFSACVGWTFPQIVILYRISLNALKLVLIVWFNLFLGEVLVWDLGRDDEMLIASSGIGDDSHREPVSKLIWVTSSDSQGQKYQVCTYLVLLMKI